MDEIAKRTLPQNETFVAWEEDSELKKTMPRLTPLSLPSGRTSVSDMSCYSIEDVDLEAPKEKPGILQPLKGKKTPPSLLKIAQSEDKSSLLNVSPWSPAFSEELYPSATTTQANSPALVKGIVKPISQRVFLSALSPSKPENPIEF